MTLTDLIVAAATALPTFLLWGFLHEWAHYLVVAKLRRVAFVDFRIWPSRSDSGEWRWASVEWGHHGEDIVGADAARVLLAPRGFDLLAVATAWAALLLPEGYRAAALVLLGGGLVDLLVGSLGISPESDLRRAADLLGVSPWSLRFVGFALLGLGIGLLVVASHFFGAP